MLDARCCAAAAGEARRFKWDGTEARGIARKIDSEFVPRLTGHDHTPSQAAAQAHWPGQAGGSFDVTVKLPGPRASEVTVSGPGASA